MLPRHLIRPNLRELVRLCLALAVLVLLEVGSGCGPVSGESSQSLLLRVHQASIEFSPNGSVALYPVSVDGDERAAILAPAPSQIRFRDIVVPDTAQLSFAIGLIDTQGWKQGKMDGARFSVDVAESSGEATTIWSQTLTPEDGNAGEWMAARVDLSQTAAGRARRGLPSSSSGEVVQPVPLASP